MSIAGRSDGLNVAVKGYVDIRVGDLQGRFAAISRADCVECALWSLTFEQSLGKWGDPSPVLDWEIVGCGMFWMSMPFDVSLLKMGVLRS